MGVSEDEVWGCIVRIYRAGGLAVRTPRGLEIQLDRERTVLDERPADEVFRELLSERFRRALEWRDRFLDAVYG